ncbi:MAG: anthranilate phosphoribosyltransferase, partial [Actinobacteria bacterium]|nr:anthranilate phosphoribosyltransferase [Actinomycetota bacterium]
SRSGAADLLESLGINITLGAKGVAECVRKIGIGFAFAPTFHPAMKHAAQARRELGVPTIFNILGPLANPAKPQCVAIGVARAELLETVVLINAAAAIAAFKGDFHLGIEQQFANGYVLAKQAVDSGAALHLVERWADLSNELAKSSL